MRLQPVVMALGGRGYGVTAYRKSASIDKGEFYGTIMNWTQISRPLTRQPPPPPSALQYPISNFHHWRLKPRPSPSAPKPCFPSHPTLSIPTMAPFTYPSLSVPALSQHLHMRHLGQPPHSTCKRKGRKRVIKKAKLLTIPK